MTDGELLRLIHSILSGAARLWARPLRQNWNCIQTVPTRKLPNIEVPSFSGKFTDWLDFKDLFKATIINDERFSNSEKLQQLKTYVQGEAADLLKSIQITDLNFPIAWKKLEDHYTNKRRLIAIYTKTLLDLPAICSESSSQLQSLLNTTTNTISLLEQLKRPTNQWDDLFVPIIAHKLDFKTLREWEKQVSKSADRQTFVQLSLFITERIDFLETTSVPKLNKSQTPANRSTSSHATFTDKCAFCAATHFITRCDAFKAKTVNKRKDFVKEKKLCVNCLGFHPISSCRSESLVAQSSSVQPALLATALVKLRGADGRIHTARAMIDPGSQRSFVSEVLLKKLGQPYSDTTVPVSGTGGYSHIPAKGRTTLQLTSAFNPKAQL